MRKRVLSLLLAICLVVGMLPPTALATGASSTGGESTGGTTGPLFKLSFGTVFTLDAEANKIYYASVTNNGATDHGTTNPGDENWNVRLDTTKAVPELTLKDLTFNGTNNTSKVTGNSHNVPAMRLGTTEAHVTSDFNINIQGTNILTHNGYYNVELYVDGKTTIFSETDGTLTANATSTSAYYSFHSAGLGELVFRNVNFNVSAKTFRADNAGRALIAKGDLEIDGANVTATSNYNAVECIVTNGNLLITNFAKVTVNTSYEGIYANSQYINNINSNPDMAHKVKKSGVYVPGSNVAPGNETKDREAIRAGGDITINRATVEVIDSNTTVTTIYDSYVVDGAKVLTAQYAEGRTEIRSYTGSFEHAFNKTPNVIGATTKYSDRHDEIILKDLDVADRTALSSPYVLIKAECTGHEWDGSTCNICGEVRQIPTDVTITLNTMTSSAAAATTVTQVVGAFETYYAVADENGVVTEFVPNEPADGNWDIKLDNNNLTAQLIFNNATLKKSKNIGGDLLTVSGDGALEIVNKGNSTLHSQLGNVMVLSMKKGTTITSDGDGLLTVDQYGELGTNAIQTAYKLTFYKANVSVLHSRMNVQWGNSAIAVTNSSNMDVIDSRLSVSLRDGRNGNKTNAASGIEVSGTLTLSNYAWVSVQHNSTATVDDFHGSYGRADAKNEPQYRSAVKAGNIVINGSSLYIKDKDIYTAQHETSFKINATTTITYTVPEHTGMFEYAINKMPRMDGVTASYSANADGSGLSDLASIQLTNINTKCNDTKNFGPTAAIDAPYVAIVATCTHNGGNADDGDCTTDIICTICKNVATKGKDAHTAGQDDTNCESPVKCVNCDTNVIEAKTHQFDNDCTSPDQCKNENCTQTATAENSHTYEGDYDYQCNKCDYLDPSKPREIAVIFGNYIKDVVDQKIEWQINPGQVYYASTDKNGVITDLGTTDPGEGKWNIMLDNRNATAILKLHNANIKKLTEEGCSATTNAIDVTGAGALNIIIEGETTIATGYQSSIVTSMKGGTTFKSDADSKLILIQSGTSGVSCIVEKAGSLTFENANIDAKNARSNKWSHPIIATETGNLTISGGNLSLEATNYGVKGLVAGGDLTINQYAKVTVAHTGPSSDKDKGYIRYAVEAGGTITVDDASLRILDKSNEWDFAINKIPNTSINVKAEYRADSNGAILDLPQDAVAPIEYPYVAFVYDCENIDDKKHNYDNETDPDCNDCGFVRDVPKTVTVKITSGETTSTLTADVCKTYYAKFADGVLEILDATAGEPTGWNIKLDNNDPVAVLTLKNVTASATANTVPALSVSGDGKLTIIAEGTSTFTATKGNGMTVAMGGPVTVTSTTKGTLSATTTNTGAYYGMTFASATEFKNVNITAQANTYRADGAGKIIEVKDDLTIDGGSVTAISKHNSLQGIYATGNVTIKNYARVTVKTSADNTHMYANSNYINNIASNPDRAHQITKKVEDVETLVPGPNIGRVNRYAINVGSGKTITIDRATVEVIDSNPTVTNIYDGYTIGDETVETAQYADGRTLKRTYTGSFDAAFNVVPTIVPDTVTTKYSASANGNDLKDLNIANQDAYANPYILIEAICTGHQYEGQYGYQCTKCGYIDKTKPRDITIRVITDGGVKKASLAETDDRNITVLAGETYYFVTNDNGLVTDVVKYNGSNAPEKWNIMLDNTDSVAKLVFADKAKLTKSGTYSEKVDGKTISYNLLTVSGEGKLNIVIRGDSTLTSGYGNVICTAMADGTTYTSENNSKLTLKQTGTSGGYAITETKGVLDFKNANIHATNNRNHATIANATIKGSFDVNVSGGSLTVQAVNCSTHGLEVGGNLTLSDCAKVRLLCQSSADNRYKVGPNNPRYAVKANGDILIDKSSLRITDIPGVWDVAINKSPNLIGGTAKYSEDAKGTNLQTLNPADPTQPVEYPYVEYVVNCADHIWENAADAECNRCGEIRAVPYDITVFFTFGTGELSNVAWEAKVGEIYYATTTSGGLVVDLGKQTTEPAKWNIKLDNTGSEAVLTLREATITRTKRPGANDTVLGITAGAQGTITAKGQGALRIVCEKASTITSAEAFFSIYTSMSDGTTYESKNNAKLTLTNGKSSATVGGINETVGNLTFDHANVSVMIKKTSTKYTSTTVSTPRDMTVIGGRVEIIGGAYATNALNVKGDLLVKENGILIVTTSSSPAGAGSCATKPYAVNVSGKITIDNATMMIKNYSGYWSYLINKMPILVGAGAYASANSTKESKLEAFTAEAGTDMTQFEAKKFIYFSNAEPGTLDDSAAEEEEDEFDDSFIFDDTDNPFTGDTVNVTLLFVLVVTSAAALVVLFSKKKALRE